MMVPQEEFIAAMICAMFFGACTFLLVIRTWLLKRKIRKLQRVQLQQPDHAPAPPLPPLAPPVSAMQPQPDPQIADLKERIKVLERITVEKEGTLAREFERLRERP